MMAYPRNPEELTFKEISKVIKRNTKPKKRLVIVERRKFLETATNEFIVQFVHRLKESARYCKFERFDTGEMTTEDELIMRHLIEGMHDPAIKHKLSEMLQSVSLTVETCIELVQQLELIKKYNQQPNEGEAYSTNKYKILCKYCGEQHVREKIIAQTLVRHALFAIEKITLWRCADTKKVDELKDTQVDRRGAKIFMLYIPMGLLRWSHLPFGIKTASHVFQRAIEKILLRKVNNIIIYQDDICHRARTREELKCKTEYVLRRLK